MSEAGPVLQHLIDGRAALLLDVERLTTAIQELDSVIARLGGSPQLLAPVATPARTSSAEPVNAGVEPVRRGGARPRTRTGTLGRRGAKKSTQGGAPKSIRLHILDMLAAEPGDLGLAEIIDRVHRAGIQAHDDAVRSITIKLMKDGKVERVGRGQYRLARNDIAEPAAANGSAAFAAPESPESPDAETNYPPPLNLGQPWEQQA
jgi:hypothetical protein